MAEKIKMTKEEYQDMFNEQWFALWPHLVDGVPFIYIGISAEAFREEHEYLSLNVDAYHQGKYTPLWVQRGEEHTSFSDIEIIE